MFGSHPKHQIHLESGCDFQFDINSKCVLFLPPVSRPNPPHSLTRLGKWVLAHFDDKVWANIIVYNSKNEFQPSCYYIYDRCWACSAASTLCLLISLLFSLDMASLSQSWCCFVLYGNLWGVGNKLGCGGGEPPPPPPLSASARPDGSIEVWCS
mgnify:CR=1 FL=1